MEKLGIMSKLQTKHWSRDQQSFFQSCGVLGSFIRGLTKPINQTLFFGKLVLENKSTQHLPLSSFSAMLFFFFCLCLCLPMMNLFVVFALLWMHQRRRVDSQQKPVKIKNSRKVDVRGISSTMTSDCRKNQSTLHKHKKTFVPRRG